MSNDSKVTITIRYVNGSEQKFEGIREKNETNLASRIQNALNANQLLLELEDKVLVIPFHNIQSIEISPPPSKSPANTVKGVRLVS